MDSMSTRKPLQLYRNNIQNSLDDLASASEYIKSFVNDNEVFDGEVISVRYKETVDEATVIKSLLGLISISGNNKTVTIFEESTGLNQKIEDLKEEVIKDELVTEKAVQKIQESVGLDDNLNIVLNDDILLSNCEDLTEAIKTLSSLISTINNKISNIDTMSSDINAIKNRLDNTDTEIEDIKDRLGSIEADYVQYQNIE